MMAHETDAAKKKKKRSFSFFYVVVTFGFGARKPAEQRDQCLTKNNFYVSFFAHVNTPQFTANADAYVEQPQTSGKWKCIL